MKLSQGIALLLSVSLLSVYSCKTNSDQARKKYYKNINKQNSHEYKILTSNHIIGEKDDTSYKKGPQKTYNESSEEVYQEKINEKAEEFKLQYDDSELANGNVYREAAAHREKLAKATPQDCNCGSNSQKTIEKPAITNPPKETGNNVPANKTVAPPKENISDDTNAIADHKYFAHLLNSDFETIRRTEVTLVNQSDKNLFKDYSVVIVALSRLDGVERLKQVFANSDDKLFFVKNNLGIYYAIIGSYDTRAEANRKIGQVRMNYNSQYTESQLIKKYGIPFTNLWVLQK